MLNLFNCDLGVLFFRSTVTKGNVRDKNNMAFTYLGVIEKIKPQNHL